MARYVYHCEHCRKNYEIEKSMARAAESESCPSCRKVGTRIFTAPGIRIKGSEVAFGEQPDSGETASGCAGCSHVDQCGMD